MSTLEHTERSDGTGFKLGFLNHLLDANRFRAMFFVTLLVLSSLPLLGLTIWNERSAVNKEYDAVTEKHLVVAQNLSLAMSRYVLDIKNVVNMFARMADLHTSALNSH